MLCWYMYYRVDIFWSFQVKLCSKSDFFKPIKDHRLQSLKFSKVWKFCKTQQKQMFVLRLEKSTMHPGKQSYQNQLASEAPLAAFLPFLGMEREWKLAQCKIHLMQLFSSPKSHIIRGPGEIWFLVHFLAAAQSVAPLHSELHLLLHHSSLLQLLHHHQGKRWMAGDGG